MRSFAASYAFGLARNHPFVDGNKRSAFVACELFLALNGWRLIASDADCVMTMLALAAGELDEAGVADWLREAGPSALEPSMTIHPRHPPARPGSRAHPAHAGHHPHGFTRIAAVRALVSPAVMLEDLPVTPAIERTVETTRQAIGRVLRGDDDRLVAVVGPCSIHDHAQAMHYARLL